MDVIAVKLSIVALSWLCSALHQYFSLFYFLATEKKEIFVGIYGRIFFCVYSKS